MLCFTETLLNNRSFKNVIEYEQEWSDIHKHAKHGFAICYDTEKAKVITEFETTNCNELLPILFEVDNEYFLIVLLYCTGPLGTSIDTVQEELTLLPSQYRTIVVGDFNLNHLLEENINLLQPILTKFDLCHRSTYATHIEGGILHLVLDSKDSNPVFWIPLLYSDHYANKHIVTRNSSVLIVL